MLYRCVACHKELSERAAVCPNCGEPNAGPKAAAAFRSAVQEQLRREQESLEASHRRSTALLGLLRRYPKIDLLPRSKKEQLVDLALNGGDLDLAVKEALATRAQTMTVLMLVAFAAVAFMSAWAFAGH